MKTILALFLVLSLVITPFAIAGGLGSADSKFMFGDAQQASAVTMSGEEMSETEGQLLDVFAPINIGVSICGVGVGAILGTGAGTCGRGDNDGIDFKIIDIS